MRNQYNFWVYMLCSNSGTLYIGMTNNLRKRVYEHKQKLLDGFTKHYDCTKLVYVEHFQWVSDAIEREKQLKKWNRKKKERLIATMNPTWKDLSIDWQINQL